MCNGRRHVPLCLLHIATTTGGNLALNFFFFLGIYVICTLKHTRLIQQINFLQHFLCVTSKHRNTLASSHVWDPVHFGLFYFFVIELMPRTTSKASWKYLEYYRFTWMYFCGYIAKKNFLYQHYWYSDACKRNICPSSVRSSYNRRTIYRKYWFPGTVGEKWS